MLKISITHNKKLIPLLNLLINCILAESALQILSLNDGHTFLVLNFLIIVVCNSSANCGFCVISFLIPLPSADLSGSEAVFYQKNYKP